MTQLFPDIGRVKLPAFDSGEYSIPGLRNYSAEMQQQIMETRLADLQHGINVLRDHANLVARVLGGVETDDLYVEQDNHNKSTRVSLPPTYYEEPAAAGTGGTTGITDFQLYVSGSDVVMAAGEVAYYKSGSDTWATDTITQQTISFPGSGTTFIYIKRTVSAADVPAWTYSTTTARSTGLATATGDTDIYWVGWVSSAGTFQNDNVGPWNEKRMA